MADDDEETYEGKVGKSDGRTFRYFGPEAKVRTAQFLGLYTAWRTWL